MAQMAKSMQPRSAKAYPLGSSDAETRRLMRQADLFAPMTRRLFIDAGISPGMRVLDLGSGAGDVALLAADLVGPTGEVVGVDKDPSVLETARDRAAATGASHVAFIEADLATFEPPGEFDALIGRFILMYQPDPAAAIRRLLPFMRPGGRIAFAEFDFGHVIALPEVPIQTQILEWWRTTLERTGMEARMGPKLYGAMLDAGLPEPEMTAEALIGGAATSPGPPIWASVVRSILPVMVRLGIATEAEVDIDTLEERFHAEAIGLRACLSCPLLVGAWSRVP